MHEITTNFKHDIIEEVRKVSATDEKVVLCTATFIDFLDINFLEEYFDIVIASDKLINSGEQKVRNVLAISSKEEKITFVSDSLTEDFPMFLIASKCFYVRENQLYEI